MKKLTAPRIAFLVLCLACILLVCIFVRDTRNEASAVTPAPETPAPATPAPTPMPTPEPTPSEPERVWTTSDVNLRKAPGTDGEVITAVKMGVELQRIEIVDNGWSKILYEDTVCYVSSSFLTDQDPDSSEAVDTSAAGSVWATDRVNLRRTPDKDGEIVAVAGKGEELQRVGVLGTGWSQILYEGEITCYIHNDYVSTSPVSEDSAETDFTVHECIDVVWTVDSTNLRKGPGTEYERVTTLNPNEELQRTGTTDNGWSRILLFDKEYYASNEFLTTVKPAEPEEAEG